MFVDARSRKPALAWAGTRWISVRQTFRICPRALLGGAATRHLSISHAKKQVLLTASATGLQTS